MTVLPVKTQTDYRKALLRIDELMDASPGTVEGEELEVLATLVEVYESEHFPTGVSQSTACQSTRR